jgi:hypothetical protein
MLTWDVIVLNGYLLLNLHICGYLLYMRFRGESPAPRWYVPFVFLSIVLGRLHPHGHRVPVLRPRRTPVLELRPARAALPRLRVRRRAPRSSSSLLEVLRRVSSYRIGLGPTRTLHQIMKVTVAANLFMFASEVFTSLYAGGAHASAVQYLLFGLHGKSGLVPWMWTAIVMNVASIIILLLPRSHQDGRLLAFACVLAFIGVWIEKGMGLIVPGFVPSTLHELVEYTPSWTEWRVSLGVAAAGLIVLTVALKIALAVLTGRVTIEGYVPSIRPPAPAREVAAE